MIGAVGVDPLADEALAGLEAAGVSLELERTGTTGIALILVDAAGENQIVVVPGANADVTPRSPGGAVLCQLEVSDEVVHAAARGAEFFALNAAPARPIDLEPDLLIVNRFEHEVVSRGRLVAVTYGADGAALFEDGNEVARAVPPRVDAVDGTAAGDAFAACLVVSLLEGRAARRGASPSLCCRARSLRRGPERNLRFPPQTSWQRYSRHDADPDHSRLRPGARRRDRSPAGRRLAGGRARGRDDRLRQPDARQDDGERTARARVRRAAATSRSTPAPTGRSCARGTSPRTCTASPASTGRISLHRRTRRRRSMRSTTSPTRSGGAPAR